MNIHEPNQIPPCPECEEPIEPYDCLEVVLFGRVSPAVMRRLDGTYVHCACEEERESA